MGGTEARTEQLRRHLLPLIPGLIAVALMLVWAIHNGGYDTDTWYWGALVLLAVSGAVVLAFSPRIELSRAKLIALGAFALYVAWSYLSITWAESKGDALDGSNRALLYLLVFAVMLMLPWTVEAALIALLTFVIGVGVIAIVLLIRLASADHLSALVIAGRLSAPTGYFNSTAALFTIAALTGTALAARRELPAPLRGLLIAFACAGLQLSLTVESRGWLFTLPLVLVAAIVIVPDRLRVIAAAVLPAAAVLAPLKRLLHVYQAAPGPALNHAAAQAGKASLALCAVMFVAGTLIAWGERLVRTGELGSRGRRTIGTVVTVAVVAIACAGGVAATHGHPFRFISRQWHGFSHQQTASTGSHFTDVGSGRYDFWRVALDAFIAHPVGGLGQDNFADYYVRHRHTGEEPAWPHSLELRLLASTGIVGFLLFAVFLVAAVWAAVRSRRRGPPLTRAVASAAMLPLLPWLIHGSIDWLWEVPALSGPALGFLGMAAALDRRPAESVRLAPTLERLRVPRAVPVAAGCVALLAAAAALGFPYLSVRETSIASDIAARNPSGALRDLSRAADLDPLNAAPGRLAGTIALETGSFAVAQQRFKQAISREPGGWLGWFGAGLAASELGERAEAHHDLAVAASINSKQPAITDALAKVYTRHPLPAKQALSMLVIIA